MEEKAGFSSWNAYTEKQTEKKQSETLLFYSCVWEKKIYISGLKQEGKKWVEEEAKEIR